ncbi:hypothetical protein IIC68_03170 [archaeon]|nr:hypothetical protein [archaeon]
MSILEYYGMVEEGSPNSNRIWISDLGAGGGGENVDVKSAIGQCYAAIYSVLCKHKERDEEYPKQTLPPFADLNSFTEIVTNGAVNIKLLVVFRIDTDYIEVRTSPDNSGDVAPGNSITDSLN